MLESYDLEMRNCISFGSDGASSVAGCNNSVWSRFQDANPHCIQVKCICHSLALCAEHGFRDCIPVSVLDVLRKVPAHFAHSAIRREEFVELQTVMEGGVNSELHTLFQKFSVTCWLVKGKR